MDGDNPIEEMVRELERCRASGDFEGYCFALVRLVDMARAFVENGAEAVAED